MERRGEARPGEGEILDIGSVQQFRWSSLFGFAVLVVVVGVAAYGSNTMVLAELNWTG